MEKINPFEKKLRTGFGFILAVLLAALVVSYRGIENLIITNTWVVHTYEVINHLQQIMVDLNDGRHSIKAYMLTGEHRQLTPFEYASRETRYELSTVISLTADNPRQQKLARDFQKSLDGYFKTARYMLEVNDTQGTKEAAKIITSDELVQYITGVDWCLRQMLEEERRLLRERESKSTQVAKQSQYIIPLLLFFDLLCSCIIYWYVMHEIHKCKSSL